jgi:hypothetical protein
VEGLFSDLLLHDLGPALGDVGQYGVFDPSSSEDEIVDDPASVADASNETGPMLPIQAPLPVVPPPTATAPAEVAGPATPAPPSTPPSVVVSAPLAPPTDTPGVVISEPAPPQAPVARFSTPVALSVTFSGTAQLGLAEQPIKRPTSGPASRFEWRTPPLWGFRDSAPYLHDGRAKTLDQAVVMHGGESTRITQSFFNLTAKERRQLETFLKSLTAPDPAELVASNEH